MLRESADFQALLVEIFMLIANYSLDFICFSNNMYGDLYKVVYGKAYFPRPVRALAKAIATS